MGPGSRIPSNGETHGASEMGPVPDLAVVDYRVILSSQAGHGLAVRGENYLVTTPEVRQGLS